MKRQWTHEMLVAGYSELELMRAFRDAKRKVDCIETEQRIEAYIAESKRLHAEGNTDASIWAMRAAVEAVTTVCITAALGGSIVQQSNAGFSSGKERKEARAPEWAKWEEEVGRVRSSNPALSYTAVTDRVGKTLGML